MKTYPIHVIATCYPALPEAEYIALRDHIKANGLQNPIVLYEEQILCGIHRDRACRELEIEAQYIRPQIRDPFEYAIGDNERRRGQLTEIQRIETADKMANLKRGGGGNQYIKCNSSNDGMQNISRERAAKLNGVSASAIDRFRRVKTQTIPEVFEAVKAGEILLATASEKIAPLQKDKQLAALEEAAKKRIKREPANGSRPAAKQKPSDWKTNPAYLALEKQSLAEISVPSIYPADAPLPLNGHNAHMQAKIQAHIRELKVAEPRIAEMKHKELGEDVYVHVQFIQTYGMEPDGMRVTGPIDKPWIDWAKSVATKMQVRKIMLAEQAKYKDAAKRAKAEVKRPNRREKDEPVFDLQWRKFQPELKKALQVFHRDDGAEVIRRTVEFLQKHFAPRQ